MTASRILVVDDEPGILEVCRDTLRGIARVRIELEHDPLRAASRLQTERFDLLLTDIRMPGMDGLELVRIACTAQPSMIVMLLTAYPTIETAVEALQLGAADYVIKPFIPEDLRVRVQRWLEERKLRGEHELLVRQLERGHTDDELVAESAIMREIVSMIDRVAATDVDALVVGESGTGKELVARRIHRRGPRAGRRFVPVDCGAIPENLLETEFFGHESGAFTGAVRRSQGLFEFADGGTLFLDEIGELPMPLQTKLLRVLQERRFRRVGGTEEIAIDVRVVAATNQDLVAMVRERRFRDDLFYRINVVRIDLPPLRLRGEDVPLLARAFISRYAGEMGRGSIRPDSDLLDVFGRYPWPGNVRELQNVVKRLLVMTHHEILTPADLPDELIVRASERESADPGGFLALRRQRMDAFEREYLVNLLESHQGDVTAAARTAQLPRWTLYRLLKKHELAPESFRS